MSELKYYKLRHIVSALASPDFTTGVVFDNHDEVYYKSEADKVIAHHKYKRCLAMAELCNARYDEEDAKVNGCGASWEYISNKMKYWERWRNKWLAIASKFKEAK